MTKLQVTSKDEKKVLDHVHWLIRMGISDLSDILPGNSLDLRIRLEILAIKVKAKYEPIQDNKALFVNLIRQALASLRRSGITKPDLDRFLHELESVIEDYLSKPLTTHLVLIPFHIKGTWTTRKRRFGVLETKFQCKNWNWVQKLSGWEQFWNEGQVILLENDYVDATSLIEKMLPLVAEVRARDSRDAFRRVSYKFELLRALVNLVQEYNMVHWLPIAKPLGISLPSPISGIFLEDGSFDYLYYQPGHYRYLSKKYENNNIKNVERLLSRLSSFSEDMSELLINMLLKYGRAMDTADWSDGYLSLWQIIEALTLVKDFRVEMKKLPQRMVNLIGFRDTILYKDLITGLAESRHLLVHEGRFSEEGFDDFQMLKHVVEMGIEALFQRAKDFPTRQSLEDFYINTKEADDLVLHNRLKVIQKILDYRKTQT